MQERIDHSDFIGTVIGKVIITEFSHSIEKEKRFYYYYKYTCECGTTEVSSKHVLLQSLRRDKGTYCCSNCRKNRVSKANRTKYLNPSDARTARLYSDYRTGAKRRNLEFNLTFDQFKTYVTSNCHYCNLEPNNYRQDNAKTRAGLSRTYFNGVDRIDSSRGYNINNCLSCCEDCNRAKRSLSYNSFLELITRIYNFKIAPNRSN